MVSYQGCGCSSGAKPLTATCVTLGTTPAVRLVLPVHGLSSALGSVPRNWPPLPEASLPMQQGAAAGRGAGGHSHVKGGWWWGESGVQSGDSADACRRHGYSVNSTTAKEDIQTWPTPMLTMLNAVEASSHTSTGVTAERLSVSKAVRAVLPISMFFDPRYGAAVVIMHRMPTGTLLELNNTSL